MATMLDPKRHPVSATLEQKLLAELRAHPIVVWLDRDDHYSTFVDELAARGPSDSFPAAVVGHRGSYVETMLALAPLTDGLDAPTLLLHVPRSNEDSIRDSPLYELYAVDESARFRITPDTLVRDAAAGRVTPEEVERFLAEGPATLPRADAWMAGRIAAASGELGGLLQELRPTELVQDLLEGKRVAEQVGHPDQEGNRAQVWHYLASHLGLRDGWSLPLPRERCNDAAGIAGSMIAWAMCVEYAFDLRRDTEAEDLEGLRQLQPAALVEACGELTRYVRGHYPEQYHALALDLEQLLPKERERGTAADLGRIDTFRFEEQQLYDAAVKALGARDYAAAGQWAHDRLEGKSFWLDRDPARKSAWILVRAAAELGQAIAACKLDLSRVGSLNDATELYAERGAVVDRLHRQLEQTRDSRLHRRTMPHYEVYEPLAAALDVVRDEHYRWADALARQWSDLCEREGALPGTGHQQRTIFDDVVAPLLDDQVKTAFILVDGLRFEMAQELLELIGKPAASRVELRPRLAELPSVTEVGMNVLAPIVEGGKLRPVVDTRRFQGFRATGSVVTRRDDRKKVIARRAGGATCPDKELPELLDMTRKQIVVWARQARLVLVVGDEIDAAGEKGAGLSVFGGAIRKLYKVWRQLRDAGIRRFVFTSDHGFLLRTPGGDVLTHGKFHDALGRYALHSQPVASDEQLAVSLRSLGYEGVDDHLLFPRGLQVYRPAAERTYVHGGNSPQERVIPVLTLVHKHEPGADDLRYRVVLEPVDAIDRTARIRARVESVDQRGLSFAEADDVDVDLRAIGEPDAKLHLLEARGGAQLHGDVARARVGVSFDLLFRIMGPRAARVPVELFHPSGAHVVEAGRTRERFDVEVVRPAAAAVPVATPEPAPEPAMPEPAPTPEPAPASAVVQVAPPPSAEPATRAPEPPPTRAPEPAPVANDWLDVFEDPGERRIFAHLAQYGSIDERTATAILGNPRKFRRFSARFDELVRRAPFAVRTDSSGPTKVYVKESDFT